MNRLTKRSRRRTPLPSPEEREAIDRKVLAAQLIALRIVQGISYVTLLEQIGHISPPKESGRRRSRERERARYEAAAEERGRALDASLALPDTRLSTLQRYGRVVGVPLGVEIVRPRRILPLRIARIIRSRQETLRRKYGQNRRRLVLS